EGADRIRQHQGIWLKIAVAGLIVLGAAAVICGVSRLSEGAAATGLFTAGAIAMGFEEQDPFKRHMDQFTKAYAREDYADAAVIAETLLSIGYQPDANMSALFAEAFHYAGNFIRAIELLEPILLPSEMKHAFTRQRQQYLCFLAGMSHCYLVVKDSSLRFPIMTRQERKRHFEKADFFLTSADLKNKEVIEGIGYLCQMAANLNIEIPAIRLQESTLMEQSPEYRRHREDLRLEGENCIARGLNIMLRRFGMPLWEICPWLFELETDEDRTTKTIYLPLGKLVSELEKKGFQVTKQAHPSYGSLLIIRSDFDTNSEIVITLSECAIKDDKARVHGRFQTRVDRETQPLGESDYDFLQKFWVGGEYKKQQEKIGPVLPVALVILAVLSILLGGTIAQVASDATITLTSSLAAGCFGYQVCAAISPGMKSRIKPLYLLIVRVIPIVVFTATAFYFNPGLLLNMLAMAVLFGPIVILSKNQERIKKAVTSFRDNRRMKSLLPQEYLASLEREGAKVRFSGIKGDSRTSFPTYEVISKNGQREYIAYQPILQEDVYLGRLNEERLKERAAEILDNWQKMSEITKDNVPAITYVEQKDYRLFVIREYIHGLSLYDLLGEKKISYEQFRGIIVKTVAVLAKWNKAGLSHGDMGIGHIYLREDLTPVVIDYDFSRAAPESLDFKALMGHLYTFAVHVFGERKISDLAEEARQVYIRERREDNGLPGNLVFNLVTMNEGLSVSDLAYAVDAGEKDMKELVQLARKRPSLMPVILDRLTEKKSEFKSALISSIQEDKAVLTSRQVLQDVSADGRGYEAVKELVRELIQENAMVPATMGLEKIERCRQELEQALFKAMDEKLERPVARGVKFFMTGSDKFDCGACVITSRMIRDILREDSDAAMPRALLDFQIDSHRKGIIFHEGLFSGHDSGGYTAAVPQGPPIIQELHRILAQAAARHKPGTDSVAVRLSQGLLKASPEWIIKHELLAATGGLEHEEVCQLQNRLTVSLPNRWLITKLGEDLMDYAAEGEISKDVALGGWCNLVHSIALGKIFKVSISDEHIEQIVGLIPADNLSKRAEFLRFVSASLALRKEYVHARKRNIITSQQFNLLNKIARLVKSNIFDKRFSAELAFFEAIRTLKAQLQRSNKEILIAFIEQMEARVRQQLEAPFELKTDKEVNDEKNRFLSIVDSEIRDHERVLTEALKRNAWAVATNTEGPLYFLRGLKMKVARDIVEQHLKATFILYRDWFSVGKKAIGDLSSAKGPADKTKEEEGFYLVGKIIDSLTSKGELRQKDDTDTAVREKVRDEVARFENVIRDIIQEEETRRSTVARDFIRHIIRVVPRMIRQKEYTAPHCLYIMAEKKLKGITQPEVRSEIEEFVAKIAIKIDEAFISEKHIHEPVIMVVDNFFDAVDLFRWSRQYNLKGIIARNNTLVSHGSIFATNLGITVMVKPRLSGGEGDFMDIAETDHWAAIDGQQNTAILNVTEETEQYYRGRIEKMLRYKEFCSLRMSLPAVNKDGKHIGVRLNIVCRDELDNPYLGAVEGVGLVRMEGFLATLRAWPQQETIEEFLAQIIEIVNGPVIIRLPDLQSDKRVPWLKKISSQGSDYLLNDEEGQKLARLVLRAVIAVHARYLNEHGGQPSKIKVMWPMISDSGQITRTKAMFEDVGAELIAEDDRFDRSVHILKVGSMIETKWAVENIDEILENFDFVSIGTNDLTASLLSADRAKDAELFEEFHPEVFRAVQYVVERTKAFNERSENIKTVDVGVCGEMGHSRRFILFLVYLATTYDVPLYASVSIPYVATTKEFIRHTKLSICERLFDDLYGDREVTDEIVEEFNSRMRERVEAVEKDIEVFVSSPDNTKQDLKGSVFIETLLIVAGVAVFAVLLIISYTAAGQGEAANPHLAAAPAGSALAIIAALLSRGLVKVSGIARKNAGRWVDSARLFAKAATLSLEEQRQILTELKTAKSRIDRINRLTREAVIEVLEFSDLSPTVMAMISVNKQLTKIDEAREWFGEPDRLTTALGTLKTYYLLRRLKYHEARLEVLKQRKLLLVPRLIILLKAVKKRRMEAAKKA
ncbi:MAG: hypothetical protein JRI96_14680, partial [Deltaproteobacteria bacterium]|nr:hypothetical protein [Deltaproteobacteria bacterium]